ncbi:MAG: LysE family translocator [Rickettsiales bacterium]|jgi:RhtB (resistance to homoserine/threonine) family protein|nr:LysE family translocator [Rickettsiales bacterium]
MENFIVISGIFLLGAMSPGPDLIITMRQSLLNGRFAGILAAIGIFFGCCLNAIISIAGLGLIIYQSAIAFGILKIIGASYLIYLAYNSFKSKGINIEKEKQQETNKKENPFLIGFLTNASNPKVILFMLALFPIIVPPETSLAIKAGYGLWYAVVVSGWFVFVSFVFSNVRARMIFSRASKYIDYSFGIILAMLGIRLLFM